MELVVFFVNFRLESLELTFIIETANIIYYWTFNSMLCIILLEFFSIS